MHKELRQTCFANQRLDSIGVELMTLSELRARVSARQFLVPERVAFFMVLVATSGHGEHLVDFERFRLHEGQAIFVRPGQVQQWQPPGSFTADVLLINPAVLQPATPASRQATMSLLRHEDWPAHFQLGADEHSAWHSLAAMLRKALDQPVLDSFSAALAHGLLVCLLLHIGRSAGQAAAPTAQAELMRKLRRELEALVHTRPSVAVLARRLRVSTSTLARTCRSVLGHSVKEEVDRHVTLEAQRLLVHSTATSVAIGELLGFTEPTNFSKFFRRRVGLTPEAFRRSHLLQSR